MKGCFSYRGLEAVYVWLMIAPNLNHFMQVGHTKSYGTIQKKAVPNAWRSFQMRWFRQYNLIFLHVFGLQPIRAVFIARISMGWIEHFAWGSVLRSEFVPRCSEALQKKGRGSNSNPDHAVMFERNAFQFRFYLLRIQVDRLQPEIDRYR